MDKRDNNPRESAVESGAPAPSAPKRLRYWLAGAVGVAVLALVATAPLWSGYGDAWPGTFGSGSARGFNVLIITLDTVRADRLGCYGWADAETPVLDGLAAGGIRFTDCQTVVPITLPAHATIFTGLDPPNHGVRHNGEYRLASEHETLAEALRSEDYETAAFVSAFVLDARFGLDQGFDLYDDDVGVMAAETAVRFAKPIYERSALQVTSAAVRWLKDRDQSRPFFAWVHYFDPHAPYQPPPPFAARFRNRLYDGEIAYMDGQIGRLMRTLEVTRCRDNTLVIVVADHGEGLGDHGETTHAKLLYDSVMRVPLIIACPGLLQSPFVVDRTLVSVADIFPTVLDLLGIKKPRLVDGESLLRAHANRDRVVYQETLAPYLDHAWSPLHALRRHTDKYILAPRPEYYDLGNDPGELDNIYTKVSGSPLAERDALVADLSGRLAKWPSVDVVAASAKALDPESLRRLQSLGYVGTVSGVGSTGSLPDPKDMLPILRTLDRVNGLTNAGKLEEALQLLEGAQAVSPRDRNVQVALGKLYLEMDRIPDAEKALRVSLAISPSARVCILLAQIMLVDGRLEEAAERLDQAEVLAPRHGGIFLARGDLYAIQRRPQDAISAYKRAQRVDPYRATAEAQVRINQIEEILRKIAQP